MIGGLRTTSRYLLAGASLIGTSGHWGSRGQSAKYARDSSTDRSDAGHYQGPAKAGAGRQGASLRGSDHGRQRQGQRYRPQGRVEGCAAILERRRKEVCRSRSAGASRRNTRTSIRIRPSRPIPTSARRNSVVPVSASRAWSATTSNTSSRSTSPTTSVAVKDAYLQYQGVKIGDTPLLLPRRQFQDAKLVRAADQRAVRRYARARGLRQLLGSSIVRSASKSAIGPITGAWRPVSSATASPSANASSAAVSGLHRRRGRDLRRTRARWLRSTAR